MGRHQHHLRLPEHLYLSPPATPPPSNSFSSSFLSVRSAVYHTSSISLFQETSVSAKAVSDKIPGFKTSAAFLTTLRANLTIDLDSAPPSYCNTPDSLRPVNLASSTGSLPPPSPLAHYDMSEIEQKPVQPIEEEINSRPLITRTAKTQDDKVDGLKLIADSVAQQRQYASRAMLFHPLTLALLVAIFGVVYQLMYKGKSSDLFLVGTTSFGGFMAFLITIRYVTRVYLDEAENVGTWKWLDRGRNEVDAVGTEDEIIITLYGELPIGALVMRGVRDSTSTGSGDASPKKKRQNNSNKNAAVTAQIRGFTTVNRYRRKGIGQGLLEEAIKTCQTKGWSGPVFAADHANSYRALMAVYNGPFETREKDAKRLLEKAKEELSVGSTTGKKGKK